MSKSSVPKFRKPAMWVVAIVAIAAAIALGAGKLSTKRSNKTAASAQPATINAEQRGRIRASMNALPLGFEMNQGQTNPQVKYTARGNNYSVFLTPNETVFALTSGRHSKTAASLVRGAQSQTGETAKSAVIDMRLLGGNPNPQISAGSELPGAINYYVGSNPKNWRTGVKQFASVAYSDVYPGVNMVFHGEQRQLEFDFVVAPGADAKTIGMGFEGAEKLTTDDSGNLVLTSSAGDVVLHKPVAYQEKDGKRENVEVAFDVRNHQRVGLQLAPYDQSRELVIDPSLSYATFLGGSGEDEVFGIALDGSGDVFVVGQMASINFPAHTGTLSNIGTFDAFVTRVKSGGGSIDFTTVMGGANADSALGVAVSGSSLVVVGNTNSTSSAPAFPNTIKFGPTGGQDAFVASLDISSGVATGTNHYIAILGGTGSESGDSIGVDSSGNAYVGGQTDSSDFKTVSPLQASNGGQNDGFIAKINPAGSALLFSTYFGGSGNELVTGLALDGSNNIYVTGITDSTNLQATTGAFQPTAKGGGDSFVSEIKPDGSGITYLTYFGGAGLDSALAIAVDAAGDACITGNTDSTDLPTANPAQSSSGGSNDVFVTKLNPTGTGLVFSTYYGGTLDEFGNGIAVDSFSDVYVTGRTTSSNYPATQGTLSGTSDAFITEFSNTGFVVYSGFVGGSGVENSIAGDNTNGPLGSVAVDSSSNAYLGGATSSTTGFPVTSALPCCGAYAGGLTDGFIAKVGAAPADFSVAVSPNSASATSGQSTSAITVTVSSVNSSYGQAVSLSCGSLPAKAVCHFSPASVTPGSTAQTSSLTIATNGASSASLMTTTGNSRVFAAMFLPVVGIALLGAGISPRRRKLLGFVLLGLVLAGLMILPACGGGSGGGGGGGGGGNTTPGTYQFTVSGAGGGVNHSVSATLTVN